MYLKICPFSIEDWILKQLAFKQGANLPLNVPAPGSSINEGVPSLPECSMSGVELESPHAVIAAEKESSFEIPGIGIISTQWIGREGRCKLIKQFMIEMETPRLSDLKKELRTLASVCLKAFESYAVENISKPDIKQALDRYVPKSSKAHEKRLDNPISCVWKGASSQDQLLPIDNIELATHILGEHVVDTITEKKRDPPHVRIGTC